MLRTPFRRACTAQRAAGPLLRLGGASVRGVVGVFALTIALALSLGVAAAAATGPPDGRVYEQASAAKKNGNEAGVTLATVGGRVVPGAAYANSAPAGNAVTYFQGGPAGETSSGADQYSVSRRNPQSGWETGAALPPEVLANGDYLGSVPLTLLPSADISRFLFVAFGPFVSKNSFPEDQDLGLYRTTGNSSEPEWLTQPTFEKFSQAKPEPGTVGFLNDLEGVYPVGGSPDLSTVYFTYFGTLVPADASRAPHVEPLPWNETVEYSEHEGVEEGGKHYESMGVRCQKVSNHSGPQFFKTNAECLRNEEGGEGEWERDVNRGHKPSATVGEWWQECAACGDGVKGPWGFYEWHNGELRSAGELPDHTYSPYGAVPAVTQNISPGSLKFPFARLLLNGVSQDGSKAFFISPQNLHAREAGSPTELYVREQTEGGPKTLLVSRDELEGGMPAPAPECTTSPSLETCAETAVRPVKVGSLQPYVYASPDGLHAFFESKDKLAKSAAEVEPAGSGPWTYEANLETPEKVKLTYLPGVVGPIAASSEDGSSFIFKNTETHNKIELWSGGTAGHVEEIASFPTGEPEFEGTASKDGAVFVFNTNAVLKGGEPPFNNFDGVRQAYRYDVVSKRLSCVSCAPEGEPQHPIGTQRGQGREIASKGGRVFFGTAAKLVPAAEHGVENVYEWEQVGTGSCHVEEREGGCVYLISPGGSSDPSFYLENDESGENVFFTTRAGLVKGDTDESYDVYDARVGGGFPEPAPPPPCGGTCRSAGAAPTLSGALTMGIGPAENTTRIESSGVLPASSSKPTSKPLTRAQKLAKALRACAKKPKRQRAACVRRAKQLYGAKAKSKTHKRRHK